tara:strand:- start:61 stop:276 length:216 start_codon:yes stop_codon:yes gene_type:complete
MNQNIHKIRKFFKENTYTILLLFSTISLSCIAISLIPLSNSARFKNSCIKSAKKSLVFKNPETKEYGINLD